MDLDSTAETTGGASLESVDDEFHSLEGDDTAFLSDGDEPKLAAHLGVVEDHRFPEERVIKLRDDVTSTACREVRLAYAACHSRGLVHATKWLIELYDVIRPPPPPGAASSSTATEAGELGEPDADVFHEDFDEEPTILFDVFDPDFASVMLGRTYFINGEYARSAHVTRDCVGQVGLFLHFYATFFRLEQKRLDYTVDPLDLKPAKADPRMVELRAKLQACMDAGHNDGFMLFLMGVICKKLELKDEALDCFVKSVYAFPLNWSAWFELSSLASHRLILRTVRLPDHWMKYFFLAVAYLELQLNDSALDICRVLLKCGFRRCLFLWSLVAVGHHNKRNSEDSVEIFQMMRRIDPFRLEMMDVLSNLLYVRDEKEELGELARAASAIDPFRVETFCIVGNHFSLRGFHDKSAVCFQRALRLNPCYLPAWTLLGHEYMEMRNVPAAILSYRNAIEVNPRDYRAWYGLGQTYELIKMHHYSLYYYRSAQGLRPHDYRMYVALGFVFEQLSKTQAALMCYQRAQDVGDPEGAALIRFGKLYDKLKRRAEAAEFFKKYIRKAEASGANSGDHLSLSYRYLAEYHLDHGDYAESRRFCDLFVNCAKRKDAKDDAKALLKKIEDKEASFAAATKSALSAASSDAVAGAGDRDGDGAGDVDMSAVSEGDSGSDAPVNLSADNPGGAADDGVLDGESEDDDTVEMEMS